MQKTIKTALLNYLIIGHVWYTVITLYLYKHFQHLAWSETALQKFVRNWYFLSKRENEWERILCENPGPKWFSEHRSSL